MTVVRDIAYVRYQAPDLDAMEAFLIDFGLHRAQRTDATLYMRACDTSPYVHVTELGAEPRTLGLGFLARNAADLEVIAERVGAKVESNTAPGGGRRVRFTDPDGFVIDVMHGQAVVAALPHRDPVAANPATGRQRFGKSVRLKPASAVVARLGHAALLVKDFPRSLEFYSNVLGFKPSDTYYAGLPENRVAAFMRCGLGATFTDHHTLALVASPDGRSRFDHSAFEVLDFDDLVQGGEHLRLRGHKHSWGVGRHIQGSQLFNYWRDPFGHKIEHWTDGDLVNDDTPVGNAPITNDELSQWAPALTPEFFT